MISARTLVVISSVVFLLVAPAANGQQNSPEPTNLTLEVYYYAKEAPAYQAVPSSVSAPKGAWYGRFQRVPGWSPPAGSHPVHAVNIKSILAGDEVRVWVSVFVGQKFDEQEKTVAVFTLREGEKVSVQQLIQFGVEPFEVALVRFAAAAADLPQVISKAKSIELVTIQGNLSTLPSHRLALRNLSTKNVSALMIRVLQNNRTQVSNMPQGKEGSPLILAGGVSEFNEPAATRASAVPGGYKPATPTNQTIEISTAIFEDGSFEGEIEPATTFRSFVKGRKIQLGRVVGLFETALQNDRSDPSGALLSNSVAALEIVAEPSVVQEVLSEFPGLTKKSAPRLKSVIEIAMNGIRKDAQAEIQRFRLGNPNLDSNSFHTWLVASKQRYAAWLSRL